MLDSVTDLLLFTRVAATGSLSGAAREQGYSPAVVSKRIARLEEALGVRLFHRTTRRLSLTEDGAAFYDRCVRILADLEEAEAAVAQRDVTPRGTLRLAIPASFGRLHIVPALATFLARYPEVRLDLHLTEHVSNMVEEGYDLAVQIDEPADSSIIARRLAPNRRIVVASPAYLRAHGTPRTPRDLVHHNCLVRTPLDRWEFEGPEGQAFIKVSGSLESTHGEVLRQAALDGVGLAVLSTWHIADALRSGELEATLTDYRVFSHMAIYAFYPSRRHLSAKVRAFVDFLADYIGPEPYWDEGLDDLLPPPAERA